MRSVLFSTLFLAAGLSSAAVPVDGWYASVFGGYSYFPGNIDRTIYGNRWDNASYEGGYNAGGRIGFQSNPMRYELEYTYLHADPRRFKINNITQTGVDGYNSANLGMANIYYDFPEVLAAISPFLGGGIGYGFLETRLRSNGPFGATSFKANAHTFAYQGTAGLTYNFSENYALNASYRYAATTSDRDLGKPFQVHMGNVGIVYHFEQGHYK